MFPRNQYDKQMVCIQTYNLAKLNYVRCFPEKSHHYIQGLSTARLVQAEPLSTSGAELV